MILKQRLTIAGLLLIMVFFAVSGLVLVSGASFLTFESAKAILDALEGDGEATKFTVTLFEKLAVRAWYIGIALLLGSGFLYLGRQKAQQYISNIITSFFSFLRELTHYFKETIRQEDKIHLYIFSVILLLGIAIRVSFLFQPVRFDEGKAFVSFAERPLFIALSYYPTPSNHLFHTFLVHLSYLLFGDQPWAIRLPALFAGILLVPASYLVIRIFYNKHAALLATGIIASSSALILYSTNARGYTLVLLIFLLLLALGKYLLQNVNSAAWLIFAILSALGFYTIPVMLYPFGTVITWLFLSIIFEDTNLRRSLLIKSLVTSLIVTVLFTFILYLPVIMASGDLFIEQYYRHASPISWSNYFAKVLPDLIKLREQLWTQWNTAIPTGITLLLVIGFFISLVFNKRLATQRIPIILATALWCISILIVQRASPFIGQHPRAWLFLLPLYIGMASTGVIFLFRSTGSKISNHKSVIFPILALALSFWLGLNVVSTQSVYYSNETGTLRDAEQITIFLKNHLKPGDKVVSAVPSDMPLLYYFHIYEVPKEYLEPDLESSHRIIVVVNQPEQTLEYVLDKKNILVTNYSAPKLIRQYEFASLHELNKINLQDPISKAESMIHTMGEENPLEGGNANRGEP